MSPEFLTVSIDHDKVSKHPRNKDGFIEAKNTTNIYCIVISV